jgi:hypothetical protein
MISDLDVFGAMVRSDENPAPIDLSNTNLDEFFQLTRVARQAPAVRSSLILSFSLVILNHFLAIQDVEQLLYFCDIGSLQLTLR